MEQQTFGFVGVGRMGGLMSGRLLDNGHKVVVFDVAEEAVAALEKRGAQRAASAAAVADSAVCTSSSGSDSSRCRTT